MNQYPYMNPYLPPTFQQNMAPQNMLPPQQILQANGKASIDALKMSPNSSVLIADAQRPMIWKCISDSLGNVSTECFDVVPHKEEAVVEQENILNTINDLRLRIERLENESSIKRSRAESDNAASQSNEANYAVDESHVQSQGTGQPNAQGEPPSI